MPGDMGFPYPAIAPVAPVRATVSFDVEWKGIVATAEIHNSAQSFKGSFLSAGATIRWSVEQPGFRFNSSEASETSWAMRTSKIIAGDFSAFGDLGRDLFCPSAVLC